MDGNLAMSDSQMNDVDPCDLIKKNIQMIDELLEETTCKSPSYINNLKSKKKEFEKELEQYQ